MVCNKCGAQLPNDAVFCNNCGANLSQQQPQIQQQPQMQQQQQMQPQMQYQYQPKPQIIQPKAKTGIAVGLVAAAMFFLGMLSNYSASIFAFFPVGALATYVLFKEEDNWLRKCAVRAMGVVISFFVLCFLIDVFFNFFDIIKIFLGWNVNSSLSLFMKLDDLRNVLIIIVNALQSVLLFIMGLRALSMKTTRMPIVDGLIDKHVQ